MPRQPTSAKSDRRWPSGGGFFAIRIGYGAGLRQKGVFTMKNAFTLLLVSIVTTVSAFGWGPQGHMMVAAIAWQKLTPAVRAEVVRLLKENPNYDDWVEGAAAEDADEIAFITAAT